MYEHIKNNRRLLSLLFGTLVTQGLIFLLAYRVNLIPSWEIGCGIICILIYLPIGWVYFIALRRIYSWLIKGIKKSYAVSLLLLYGLLMYGWLIAGLWLTLLFYVLGSGTLFESYNTTIKLPLSGQEVYLYRSDLIMEMTAVYLRHDRWPMKKKIVTVIGGPRYVSVTEKDSMIYISGYSQIYEYNSLRETVNARDK